VEQALYTAWLQPVFYVFLLALKLQTVNVGIPRKIRHVSDYMSWYWSCYYESSFWSTEIRVLYETLATVTHYLWFDIKYEVIVTWK